ncbi:MAG: DNA-binding protein [Chloroflexi bacterium]|nr:MAG: DNA-binding protein [Chloroflexota bacterium]
MVEEWITTDKAAKIVGVTTHQIRHLLRNGLIKGQKFARSWMVDRQSAEEYAKQDRKPGPKPQDD